MQFASTGGIFLRLDTSGNLNIYNTAGTSIAKFVGTNFSSTLNKVSVINAANVTTVSTTYVSTGIGALLTTQVSGKVLAIADAGMSNAGGGTGTLALFLGASVPSNGSSTGADSFLASLASTSAVTIGVPLIATFTATVGVQLAGYIGFKSSSGANTVTVFGGGLSTDNQSSQVTLVEM